MTKTEQVRLVTWRSKMLQRPGAGWTVAHTCRHFGISRKTFYKWKKRQQACGDAGLCDRARTPRRWRGTGAIGRRRSSIVHRPGGAVAEKSAAAFF